MAGSPSEEKHALLSLVEQSSEGQAWSAAHHGWSADSDVPVCDWEGITCNIVADSSGMVGVATIAEISLPEKGLSGTIPTELGLLQDLQVLTLKDNMLQGSIPQEVANLPKLVTLDLTECFLTGTLPQTFKSPKLSTLLLANNAVSGHFFQTESSPHLQSIKEIRMENNLLTGTLSGNTITKMPHLETLSISANDLSGLLPGDELGSRSHLKYLYVDNNSFVGPLPSQLAQVGRSNILELWVQDNALSGTVPASYVRFDKMHDFYIDGNKLTGALPPDLCGPEINADFFQNVPPEAERNYCDSIACPAGSVAFEGVYPCEKCPGGEAARLKNRYLGQTGKCSNYTQRDVLRIFHESTTKAGPWTGVSDWNDEDKPVCDMTGVTCDAHGNVVEIVLSKRRLEGHIPSEIGFLSFLETLNVSDNGLMGFVPSDLQWTALSRLDISGNKIRGIIPPLLCMKEALNGNGADNVFYCDRVACPMGTYNSLGFHHGVEGETCQPCYDSTPFIGQKTCQHTKELGNHFVQMVEKTGEEIGVSSGTVLVLAGGVLLFVAILLLCLVKCLRSEPNKKKHAIESSERAPVMRQKDSEYHYEEETMDDYSFSVPGEQSRYRDQEYKDYITSVAGSNIEDEEESPGAGSAFDDDDNASRTTTRSATELLSEHKGLALNRSQKLKNIVSERMPADLSRRAKMAASSINVSARRLSSKRRSATGGVRNKGSYDYDEEYDNEGQFQADLELAPNSNSPGSYAGTDASRERNDGYDTQKTNVQHSDLLDVPMIT